ncbi:MAG: LytR/AlgR family response regulator transcription factor [Chitinophagales bacterium]
MKRYKAVIIDDEEPGRRNLSVILEKYCPEIEVVGEAENAVEGKQKLLDLEPDLVFLDVQMPDQDGFDLLDALPRKDFAVIIVTAHAEYGIRAVKAGALDYILKPIVIKELQQAINKVIEYDHKKNDQHPEANKPGRITLSHTGGFTVVEIKDIIRLEADNNYTKVFAEGNKMYFVSKPLKVFEDNLKDQVFFRVHRSYIINLNHVKEFLREDGGVIVMADNTKIQLPKSRINDFMDAVRKLSISI